MSFPKSLPPSRIKSASDAPAIRWGILGAGWIAEKFIESVRAHTNRYRRGWIAEQATSAGIRLAHGLEESVWGL